MKPQDLEDLWGPVVELDVKTFPDLVAPPPPLVVKYDDPRYSERVIGRINPQTFVPGKDPWRVLDQINREENAQWAEGEFPADPVPPPVTRASFGYDVTRRCRHKDATEPCWDAVPEKGFKVPPRYANVSACLGHCAVAERHAYFTPEDLLGAIDRGGGIPEVLAEQYRATVSVSTVIPSVGSGPNLEALDEELKVIL